MEMKMKSNWLLILLMALLPAASGTSQPLNRKSISSVTNTQNGNINHNIDLLLENFKSALPSQVKLNNIDDKLAYDCYLTGLSNGLHRQGDAVFALKGTRAVFSFGLATNRLTVQCRWKKRVLVKLSGSVKATTDKVSVQAKLSMEIAPGSHPQLEEFKVTELQKIKTDVSGLGLLNWIGEKILNRKVNGAKDRIIQELEQHVSAMLEKKLQKVTLPLF